MAEGWKQVLEDMRAVLLGRTPEPKPQKPDAPVDDSKPDTPIMAESDSQETEFPVEESDALVDENEPDVPALAAFGDLEIDTLAVEEIEEAPADFLDMDPLTEAQDSQTAESLEAVTGDVEAIDLPDDQAAPLPETAPTRRWSKWEVAFGVVVVLVGGFVFLNSNGLLGRMLSPRPPAPDVIATFDGGQITISDVEAHLSQLVGDEMSEAMLSQQTILLVIEDMAMDELVQRWAAERQPEDEETFSHAMQHINEELSLNSIEAGLHEGDIPVAESEIQAYYNENRALFGDQSLTAVREQIRQTLVAEQEQDYVTGYIEQLKENASVTRFFELLDAPAPTEDDLRRYYEENREQFALPRQAVVDELQFPIGEDETAARQAADDALLKLRSGADFADIPQDIPSALLQTGVSVDEGWRDPAWDTAVFAMTNGELSNVFQAGNAFYIVRLLEKQNARTQTFEEVRPFVEAAVAPQVVDDWFAANASKTLFTLKSNRYTVGEFYQEYQELPFTVQSQFAGPEGMKDLAEQLIERLLLVADANDRLLDVENQDLAQEARLQILKQMLHQEEVDDKIEITDEDIQQFYEENQELMAFPSQARIRYIRIGLGNSADEAEAAQQRADEAYEKLNPGLFQQGEDFAVVAQEYSEDPETAANGGELPGWVGESDDILAEFEMHPFHEAILNLRPDEISQPFEFGGSLYIVQVIERTEPETVDMEEARPFIEEILTQQKHSELEIQLQEQLLDQAEFEIYWPALESYIQQLPTPAAPFPFGVPIEQTMP